MSFTCDTCFDTETIDQGGREISCPDCVFHYHPSSVTIEANPLFGTNSWSSRYIVRDRSQGDYIYGGANDMEHAKFLQRKRQGVIKAALTRRANKARRNALKGA